MGKRIKTKAPGSIITKKMRSGKEYIYYNTLISPKRYVSSGLLFSPTNVKIVEELLQQKYKDDLLGSKYKGKSTNGILTIEAFEHFTTKLKEKDLSPRTIYEYKHSFELIISGDYPIEKKTNWFESGTKKEIFQIEHDIRSFLKTTENRNNTINKHLRQFQTFINYIIDMYDFQGGDFHRKYKVKKTKKLVVPYSNAEAKAIIKLAKEKDEVLYLTIMLYYLTGARLSEWLRAYFNQDPYNVDLKTKSIKFRNKINKGDFQLIPMSEKVEQVLIRLRELESERKDYKNKVIPYSEKGQSTIIKKITKLENELGIKQKGRSTHGFRRLLATELFAKEVPIDVIKDIMRHSSITTTMESYREIDKSRIKDSLEKLDR